jgi:uncharacterized protein YjiS (DUF1127 family)
MLCQQRQRFFMLLNWLRRGLRRRRPAASLEAAPLGRFSATALQDIGLSRSDLPAIVAGMIGSDASRRQR